MIIINQEGKRFNFDNIIYFQAVAMDTNGEVVCKLLNNESYVLGEYETFERAEEVVKQIDNCYYNFMFYSSNQSTDKVMCMNTAPKIYTMPQE